MLNRSQEIKLDLELAFWTEERHQYLKWYQGELRSLYYAKTPQEDQKIKRFEDPLDNALHTWIRADWDRYLRHLMLNEYFFQGKKIIDIGGGPLGLASAFVGANVTVLDPLASKYEEVGYPLGEQNLNYLDGRIEDLSHTYEDTFDAAISVNAIDHVDDFELAVKQIERIVKETGILRIEVHYHATKATEPIVLDDRRVENAFSTKFKMKKVSDLPFRYFYPDYNEPDERLALWSNSDIIQGRNPLPTWTLP